jgi:hypothetical protein
MLKHLVRLLALAVLTYGCSVFKYDQQAIALTLHLHKQACVNISVNGSKTPLVVTHDKGQTSFVWGATAFNATGDPIGDFTKVTIEQLNHSIPHTYRATLDSERLVIGEIAIHGTNGGMEEIVACNASFHIGLKYDCNSHEKWTSMKSIWCCERESVCNRTTSSQAFATYKARHSSGAQQLQTLAPLTAVCLIVIIISTSSQISCHA